MATFRIEDSIVKTENASASWDEGTRWNGSNRISRATGSQWAHQTLYRSRRGRYYIVHSSQWQGTLDHAEWVSPQEAARWLLENGREIPDDLLEHAESVTE
jgi:hypothetical protein